MCTCHSTPLAKRPTAEDPSGTQREMQARLAYMELLNPTTGRQEAGVTCFESAPRHQSHAHYLAHAEDPTESQRWSGGDHLANQTGDSLHISLETGPSHQTSGTSRPLAFSHSVSMASQSSGDDATKRRKNTEASGG